MSDWQPVATAPKDGTIVRVVAENQRAPSWSELLRFAYPIPAKVMDGKWVCDMGDRWSTFDPQPTHWMPMSGAKTRVIPPLSKSPAFK